MTILSALLLSLVEGITEFLPVSSTGHLILASRILGVVQTEFTKSFDIYIQLGAIAAVVVVFWKTLVQDINVWKRILAAFVPTMIVGLVLYKFIKAYLLGNEWVTVAALLTGGILLIVLEKLPGKKSKEVSRIPALSFRQAGAIGLVQSLSVVPGVSRSAATILGGMYVGLSREAATEFSFLLAVPTMAAATALDLVQSEFRFSGDELLVLAVGMIGSFVFALIAIKFLLSYVKKHTFVPFGVYRIVVALLFWFIFLR